MKKLQPIYSHYIDAQKEAKPLPDLACSFVMMSNWTAANDVLNNPGNAPTPDDPLNEEIYFGADGACVHQLFTGDTTVLLPVVNANQIFVRCSQSNTSKRVYFTCFEEI